MSSEEFTFDIMNVRTAIDTAFGDTEANTVNFKLIQAILYLLARQLRILDRRVAVEIPFASLLESSSSLEVTEVKVHAVTGQPKQAKQTKTTDKSSSSNKDSSSKSTKADSIKTAPGKDTKDASAKKKGGKETAKGKDITKGKDTAGKKAGDIDTTKAEASKDATKAAPGEKKGESSDKGKDDTVASRKAKPSDYLKTLDELIEMREKELRVIRQRADSNEEPDPSPTPMASVTSVDAQYEKLLVVERVPSGSSRDGRAAPKISVVTQEEFEKLANIVKELEERFKPIGSSFFPENAELMENLRKNASLTDAMAALQLSARLEAAEKVLENMTSILAGVISNSPDLYADSQLKVIHEADAPGGIAYTGSTTQPAAALQATDSSGQPQTGPPTDATGAAAADLASGAQAGTAQAAPEAGAASGPMVSASQPGAGLGPGASPSQPGPGVGPGASPSQPGAVPAAAKSGQKTETGPPSETKNTTTMTGETTEEETAEPVSEIDERLNEFITQMQLDKALNKLASEFMKKVSNTTARNANTADQALKLATSFGEISLNT